LAESAKSVKEVPANVDSHHSDNHGSRDSNSNGNLFSFG
jgi:hypothetical protein